MLIALDGSRFPVMRQGEEQSLHLALGDGHAKRLGRPVPRLTLLFFSATKVPEAAETVSARTVRRRFILHDYGRTLGRATRNC